MNEINVPTQNDPALRHDWTAEDALALFNLPFADLIHRAQTLHRRYFDANTVQMASLLSVKTGGCPEDCAYCPQAAQYDTGVDASKLMDVDTVLAEAKRAKDAGATRYCMGRPGDRLRTKTWTPSAR